jgi:anti-sigma factor RsiW
VSVVGLHVVGLHPEELLDRAQRGQLSEQERARLDAHLAHCAACRVEQQMRADFAEELEQEVEVRLPNLAGLAEHAAQAPVPVPQRTAVRRSRKVQTAWLLVAAALVFASAAAGAGARGRTWFRLMTSSFVSEPAPAQTPVESTGTKPAAVARPVGVSPKGPDGPLVEELEAATPPNSPAVAVAPAQTAESPRPAPSGAAHLFDAERAARVRGDYAKVMYIHQELLSRYPGSREALVSRATVGQLLLDRGDPAAALASFEAYLAGGLGVSRNLESGSPGGRSEELTELSMVGRATALDRLGRGEEARRAWRALLIAFPDTPYAKHAAARAGTPSASNDTSGR